MSKKKTKVWCDFKKGDPALVMSDTMSTNPRITKTEIKSVGRKWITTETGEKFSIYRGFGDFGTRVHTPESWKLERLRKSAMRHIRGEIFRYDLDPKKAMEIAKILGWEPPAPADV